VTSPEKKLSLLRRAFGDPTLSNKGKEALFFCPQCKKSGKRKKKLSIRIEDGVYHCWVCELKGKSLFYLFGQYCPALQDSLKDFGYTSGATVRPSTVDQSETKPEAQVPEGFVLLGANTATQDPDIKDTIKYCFSRGLSLSDLWYFKLGTCAAGRLRRRVIFPSFDQEGKLNYYTARAIDPVDKMKYVNSKVPKSDVIFNEINIDWTRMLTLVEGPFDLTKSPDNSTCLLGSSISKDSALFRQIVRHETPVILALDYDARKKSHTIAKLLTAYGVDVKTVDVPSNRDLGDMTKMECESLIKSAASWSSSDRLKHLISNIRSGSII
jgi:hypothetical protein